jgi:predicted metal-dependent hydrolase
MKGFVQLAFSDWLQPLQATPPADTNPTTLRAPEKPLNQERTVDAALHASHPQANRQSVLFGVRVGYRLTRSRRRSIGLSIGPDGLDVRAPSWVSLAAIEQVLQEKAEWVLRKLQEMQAQRQRMHATRIEWRDGAVLPFLGQPVQLVLDASHAFQEVGAKLEPSDSLEITPIQRLRVSVAQQASPEQIRDAVQAWLMGQARQWFVQRLNHFAPLLGVQWRKLSLSQAATRWGSAGADGSIRLHWRLVHFKPEIIDYVVVHELSHLRVMDHSPLFWDTVRTVVPDYAQRRAQLRDEQLPQWAQN